MSWVDEQLALGDDLAARRALYISRGIFGSPADAPPRCEPNGGDRTMLSYRCPRCPGVNGWGVPAEPRAWGYDFDPLPESGWCPSCGAEGVLQHVESAEDMLRRTAPELFTTA